MMVNRILFLPVFPAQAGVIPDMIKKAIRSGCIPRASGGDPMTMNKQSKEPVYSPRKRG